ncbi:MAG: hypothetical protein M3619_29500, partial [Myxococcota bacterium]|nr:hypothetical protein [Myxococcota bacterium]
SAPSQSTAAGQRTAPASPRVAGTRASGGDTQVTTMAPVPISGSAAARNAPPPAPVRHELVAGHRAAVREAVSELGYAAIEITGDDRDADLRELADKLAAATDDLERGVIMYAMGQAERSRDDCIGAGKHWAEARKVILDSTKATVDPAVREQRRAQAFRFYGRTVVAEGLCALTNGRALGTDDKILKGVQNLFGVADTERAQAWFAMGIAMWETGDEKEGVRLVLQAARAGDAKLRQTIERYASAVGMKLSP